MIQRDTSEQQSSLVDSVIILLLLGALFCTFLGIWFASTESETVQKFKFTPTDPANKTLAEKIIGETGLFTVEETGTVYRATVSTTRLATNTWVAPELELLDADGGFLMSFAKELWHETGYDDGHWDEDDYEMQFKFTLDGPSAYNLQLTAEGNTPTTFELRLQKTRGSSLPATTALVFFLIAAVLLNEMKRQTIFRVLSKGS